MGTAYGAQMINEIKKSVDIDAAVLKGDLSPVTSWLNENIHRHGETLLPGDLLRQATGEPFDPKHYIDYLSEKFTSLYLS